MLKEIRRKRALSHAHSQWNGLAFVKPSASMSGLVQSFFKPSQILHTDNEILVTEVGFVTMAIHTDRAVRVDNVLVVPGIDSEGLRGHLILRDNCLPYHSFQSDVADACLEARQSQQRARRLVQAFGTKSALVSATMNTPWYALMTEKDFERSGLCRWGADSFLRRYGLNTIARKFGLPGFLLRTAGPYGKRVIAANLIRTGRTGVHLEQPV